MTPKFERWHKYCPILKHVGLPQCDSPTLHIINGLIRFHLIITRLTSLPVFTM